jgi:hypothetical protein
MDTQREPAGVNPDEPAQEYTVSHCYDVTGTFQTGTATITRMGDGDNMATLTIDDGQGNRAAVLIGWREAVNLMQYTGAVAVYM